MLIQDATLNRDISMWGDFTNNGVVNCRRYQDSMGNFSINNGLFQVESFVLYGYTIFLNNGTFFSDSLLNQSIGNFEGNGTVTSNVIINRGVFDTRGQINTNQIINHGSFTHYEGIKCNSLTNFGNFYCTYPTGPNYHNDSLLISGDLINHGGFITEIYTGFRITSLMASTVPNTTMFMLANITC
ncbi:MAG: hypothetical protein IPG89_00700 [Bacteroidetes bacterium]|nr:hypothetical protein [Bacteroidota bacterium]